MRFLGKIVHCGISHTDATFTFQSCRLCGKIQVGLVAFFSIKAKHNEIEMVHPFEPSSSPTLFIMTNHITGFLLGDKSVMEFYSCNI